MRISRPRLTLRWMMVVIAIAALPMWAKIQVDARRIHFAQLVRKYYDERAMASGISYSGPGGAIMEEYLKAAGARRSEAMDYYSDLIQKYERAVRRPWLPVEADPPKPK